MQIALSRIWTLVTSNISCDDNLYTKHIYNSRMVHHCVTDSLNSTSPVLNSVFPSPRAVALLWLMIPNVPYYLSIKGEEIDSCISQGHWHKMKCKQPYPGFELGFPSLFLVIVTILPCAPAYHDQCRSSKILHQGIFHRKEQKDDSAKQFKTVLLSP